MVTFFLLIFECYAHVTSYYYSTHPLKPHLEKKKKGGDVLPAAKMQTYVFAHTVLLALKYM